MTLVRISLPDTEAEVAIHDARTGARIPVKGGETVSIDIDVSYPIKISVVVPADVYVHKTLKSMHVEDNMYTKAPKVDTTPRVPRRFRK